MGEQEVWESEEAERLHKQAAAPFFPEWVGYLGRSWLVRKLQVHARYAEVGKLVRAAQGTDGG